MINRIKIEGYKSIKILDLELKPINILIGANGVGKSNFISFFKLMNAIYEQRLQNYVITQGGADNLLHFGRKITDKIYWKIQFENNSYYFILKPTIQNKPAIDTEASGYNANWNDDTYNYFPKKNLSESCIKESIDFRDKYLKDYLQSLKIFHFHDTGDTSPLKTGCLVKENKYLKGDGSNLPAFLYYLQEKHPKSFLKIEKMIQSVAPYFERFELQPDRLNENYINLEWREISQPEGYFNATHLSDGTLRFIALVTLLMQPNLPETIIIDELELGLHPFAINKLAGLIQIASAQSQVIVATQSVNFIDNFEPEDVIVVDRKGTESTFNRLNSNELEDWLENYTLSDLWNKNVIGGRP